MAKNKKKSAQKSVSKAPSKDEKIVSIKLELIALGVVTVLFVLSIVTAGFSKLPFNLKSPISGGLFGSEEMDKDELKERLLEYINSELLGGQSTAEISEITEDDESGMYKVKLVIAGTEYESFVSKDGKFLYTQRNEVTEPASADYPKSDKPELLLFTMSYCPYGNVADDFVNPVDRLLGDNISFEPHYVIYDSYAKNSGAKWNEYCLDKEEKYCSMHGVQELNQNVRELCTFKYQPEKYWDFVLAANEKCDASNVDSCWEGVAKDLGVDIDKIKSCQSEEALSLLANEVSLNEKYSVSGSPTIILNGKLYEGNRTPEDLKLGICSSFNNEPDECSQTLGSDSGAPSGSCN
ncbi:MAG: hypothetical protein ABIE03_07475 [Patescibacteria group bacterium]|nr:DsbA family protein [Patescibacteria group bacterium]